MRQESTRILCAALATFGLGLSSAPPAVADSHANGGAQQDDSAPNDPWEGFNRGIFSFNEKLDLWFMRPVAKGWDFVMPDLVQTGLRNLFANARFPVIFVNDLFQLKPLEASEDLGRFLLNTTVGVAGLWDPAERIGLPGNNEDFGQTLGYWGVPAGPFLVLPFLGPSSPRDAVGLVADSATMVHPYFVAWYVSAAITATSVVNTRAHYLEEIDESRRTALDFYSFTRNAYVSYRENLVNDRAEDADAPPADNFYYFEEEEDGEETLDDAEAEADAQSEADADGD